MKRFLLIVLLLALALGGAWAFERWNFEQPGPASAEKIVLVEPGDHVNTIARHLADSGVVMNADLFRLGLRLRDLQGELKAGEYAFPAHASMHQVADILISGKSIQHKLTAAEGLTSEMIYKLVVADPVLVGDPGPMPREGTLLPETYLFTRGTTRKTLLARMAKDRRTLLDRLWAARADALPIKTKEEAIALASIVEKETGIARERRHVAGVFVNRLKLGMKLQSDPTIIYDITRGYPLGRGIRESELLRASPHNTYAIAGLPPTPICNPGKDAIAAVLNPAATADLYFVANGTGGHAFSATQDEQNRNVALWRQIEKTQKQPPPAALPPPPLRK